MHLFLFVLAFQKEAQKLIEHYSLYKIIDSSLPFPIYRNKEETIWLTITGIGKMNSAVKTAVTIQKLRAKFENSNLFSINIGIAGKKEGELGKYFLANKIYCKESEKTFYPFFSNEILKNTEISLCNLTSVNTALEDNYPIKGMIDMEASGFYESSSIFLTKENIYVLKCISDYDKKTFLNAKQSADKVLNKLPKAVDSLKENLCNSFALPKNIEIKDYKKLTFNIKLSYAENEILKKQISKLLVLEFNRKEIEEALQNIRPVKKLISHLKKLEKNYILPCN